MAHEPFRLRAGAYETLWPGIDMVFSGRGGTLKYEFVVEPGASVKDISLAYRGAQGLSVDAEGALVIDTVLDHEGSRAGELPANSREAPPCPRRL